MNKLLFFLFCTFLIITEMTMYSQSVNCAWVKTAVGINSEFGNRIAVDPVGNVVVTGYFDSSPVSFGTTTLTSSGTDDIFIVKYDPNGNVIWARSVGGPATERSFDVTTDTVGNVFVAGFYGSPTLVIGTDTLMNAGGTTADILVIKYDPSGNVIWARSAGGAASDFAATITTDLAGNVFIGGHFSSPTLIFGTDTLNAFIWTAIVAKYDAYGNEIWAIATGGTDNAFVQGIATDAAGNLLVTGRFYGPTTAFGSSTVAFSGGSDIFIAKYDTSGNLIWVKSYGGTGFEIPNDIDLDATGNILVTGSYDSPTFPLGTTTLVSSGPGNYLLAKYDVSGNAIWAKSAIGTHSQFGQDIDIDPSGNIFVIGSFNSPSLIFGATTLTATPSFNILVVKYDTNGNVVWAKTADGMSGKNGNGISVNTNGDVYITGNFIGPTFVLDTTTFVSQGLDLFVAKLVENNVITNLSEYHLPVPLFFPNPFSTSANVEFSANCQNGVMLVYDALGKIVKRIDQEKRGGIALSRDGLAEGTYFFLVKDGDTILFSGKFVVSNN